MGSGAYDYSWTFDQLGNVKTWTNELASTTETCTHGAGSAGPHAATAFDGGTYTYDLNGNQKTRPNGDTLQFDVANRLASYTTGGSTTSFTYDADGVRVVRDEGSNETVYIGGIYETDDNGERSYYTFAGQVVAYRLEAGSSDDRYYLVSDHLGTNSHQLEYDGADPANPARSSQYYYPYGGNRATSSGGLDTDRGYTGQVSDASHTGLLFYNARYYDPQLRRFISADTIIPNPGNPQDLNRYTYVRNNPVRYNDPTGHQLDCLFPWDDPTNGCAGGGIVPEPIEDIATPLKVTLIDAPSALIGLAADTIVEYRAQIGAITLAVVCVFGTGGACLIGSGLYFVASTADEGFQDADSFRDWLTIGIENAFQTGVLALPGIAGALGAGSRAAWGAAATDLEIKALVAAFAELSFWQKVYLGVHIELPGLILSLAEAADDGEITKRITIPSPVESKGTHFVKVK